MTRILSAIAVSVLFAAAPALAEDTGKTRVDSVKPDGTKVSVEEKKNWKDDGTGTAKTEVKTEDPATGVSTKKTTKVKKSKNMDGTVDTKTEVKTESGK